MSTWGHLRKGRAFDVPDFLLISHLEDLNDTTNLSGLRGFDITEDFRSEISFKYNDLVAHGLDLPALEDLNIDPPPPLDEDTDLSCSNVSLPAIEHLQLETERSEDVWEVAKDLPPLSNEPKLLSWEAFANRRAEQWTTLSAPDLAGPEAFDAALARATRNSSCTFQAGRPLQTEALLRSLWQLGLGRESKLFRWDAQKHTFEQAVPDGRASGCSLESSQSFFEPLLRCGNSMRRLQAFMEQTRCAADELPARHALAGAVDAILSVVEDHVTVAQTALRSLPQLQAVFEPVQTLVDLSKELVDGVENVKTDDEVLNNTWSLLQRSDEMPETAHICRHFLKRITWHWLRKIEGWSGIGPASMSNKILQGLPETPDPDEAARGDGISLPDFVSAEDADLIAAAHRCLGYLKEHHEIHPLVRSMTSDPHTQSLNLEFDFDKIELLQQKADKYRHDVLVALAQHSTGGLAAGTLTLSKQESSRNIAADAFNIDFDEWDLGVDSISMSSKPLPNDTLVLADELQEAVRIFLQSSYSEASDRKATYGHIHSLTPPFSLVPSLSIHSLLRTQHDLLSYTALQCILHEHSLLSHLELQQAFSLFGSGLFVARLRTVLFSADTETTERQSGVRRTGGSSRDAMGLHLGTGDRQQWPPASSEMRLALMNVIPDIWREEVTHLTSAPTHTDISHHNSGTHAKEIAAAHSLSFTIRTDLGAATITKILDSNSIHALDFLALTYTPPSPLHPLFPPRVLAHYDRIFVLQLRLLRVSAAVTGIHAHIRALASRASQFELGGVKLALRLSHALQTFHGTILAHVRYAAIDGPWSAFLAQLKMAAHMCKDPYLPLTPPARPRGKQQPSLDALAALHETTLRRMLDGLLLRKKQRAVMEALEGVWELVLKSERRLVALANESTANEEVAKEGTRLEEALRTLLQESAEKKAAFVKECKRLLRASDEGKAMRSKESADGELADLIALLRWDDNVEEDEV